MNSLLQFSMLLIIITLTNICHSHPNQKFSKLIFHFIVFPWLALISITPEDWNVVKDWMTLFVTYFTKLYWSMIPNLLMKSLLPVLTRNCWKDWKVIIRKKSSIVVVSLKLGQNKLVCSNKYFLNFTSIWKEFGFFTISISR